MRTKTKFLAVPYLLWMTIFIIAPLLFVAYFAFTDSAGNFSFQNIIKLGDYIPVFITSIWLGAVAAFLCLIIAYPVAYFIANTSEKWQKFLIMLIMLPMCMSFLLRTIAWVSLLSDNGIINNTLTAIGLSPLPLIRNNGAVILGMVYNYLPFMIMPLYTVLVKMDSSVINAARDLGANSFQVFRRVILPMSLPGIVTGITMVFVPAVSTFYISRKLGNTSLTMIGDVIESQFKTAYNPNLGAAMSLGLMVLIFICMGIMNRFSKDEEDILL